MHQGDCIRFVSPFPVGFRGNGLTIGVDVLSIWPTSRLLSEVIFRGLGVFFRAWNKSQKKQQFDCTFIRVLDIVSVAWLGIP